MKKYIALHVISIILTIASSVWCGIILEGIFTATDQLEKAASIAFGVVFALFGAGAYLIAMILGAIGWGLTRKQGGPIALFVVETVLPIVFTATVFGIIFIYA
ncbi:MAG: hypothetical protein J6V83_03045 [Clostridia bacterium]|nr:hypothetical protein [Clostridia bacterium]